MILYYIAASVNALVLLAGGKRINSPVFDFQSRLH